MKSAFQIERSPSLYVVVVLYQRGLTTSPTCQSLLRKKALHPQDTFLIYDNSPSSDWAFIPEGWQVVCNPKNGGLLTAYTYAFSQAKLKGCPWVLLLDQDTELPEHFLESIHANIAQMQTRSDVVAIVPVVRSGNRQVSPVLPKLGRETPFQPRNVIETQWLSAINSGTCLRVEFIESVGGFCELFWLDYLDHWLFKVINNSRKSVFVTDMELRHDLSVADMNRGLNVQRYNNVLTAERRFTNLYLPPLWRIVLIPRLLARAFKHLIFTHDKRLARSMAAAAATQLIALVRLRRGPTELP
jgi:GT2 family glycosyltransferase